LQPDGAWGVARNIGYPFNTTNDDLFYTTTVDGLTGYITSYRADGKGEKDIYEIRNDFLGVKGHTVLKGEVVTADGSLLPENLVFMADVTCLDCEDGAMKHVLYTRKRDGRFMTGFQPCKTYTLTYYDATTFDQIIPIQVTGASGYTSKFINAGSVNNKGIEAILNVTPVRTKDLSWTLTFNFAKNKNEVVELYDENTKEIVIATFQSGVSLVARPGLPYGVLVGRGFVYTNGQKTVRDDGYYMSKSAQVIGNVTPDWFGGIGSTLSWKNISFNFLISAKFGGDIYSLDQAYGQYVGLYPETAGTNDLGNPVRNTIDQGGGLILDGVKEDGSKNDIRVSAENSDVSPFGIANNPNEAFIYDASFVKLRELNLTYSLDKKLFENSRFIKGADISLTGRNLWIIHKNLPYADPEDIYSAGNVSGHQGGAYPSVRTFGFNVKLKF